MERREEGPELSPRAQPHSDSPDLREEPEGKRTTRKCVESWKARENYADKSKGGPGDGGWETDEDEDLKK